MRSINSGGNNMDYFSGTFRPGARWTRGHSTEAYSFTSWEELSKPAQFMQAALEQRRVELNDPGYFPRHVDKKAGSFLTPGEAFDQVYRELWPHIERPPGGNLAQLLDPENWNLKLLSEGGRLRRRPRVGITTDITQGGFLYVTIFVPDPPEGEAAGEEILIYRNANGGGGWGGKAFEEVIRVRGFEALAWYSSRGQAAERYLRSAKLLVLACKSYIEWLLSVCRLSVEIVEGYALYICVEGGPEGEQEIGAVEINRVEEVLRERERVRAAAGAEREARERDEWLRGLQGEWGFTAEQAAGAVERAGGKVSAAHRIILEIVPEDLGRKPSQGQFRTILEKLRRARPDLFTPPEG